MPGILNKDGSTAKTEAIDIVLADVSAGDYDTRNDNEHFGLLLTDQATLKVQTVGGTIGSFDFPPGYNPVALKKIYNDAGNTITEIQVYY